MIFLQVAVQQCPHWLNRGIVPNNGAPTMMLAARQKLIKSNNASLEISSLV